MSALAERSSAIPAQGASTDALAIDSQQTEQPMSAQPTSANPSRVQAAASDTHSNSSGDGPAVRSTRRTSLRSAASSLSNNAVAAAAPAEHSHAPATASVKVEQNSHEAPRNHDTISEERLHNGPGGNKAVPAEGARVKLHEGSPEPVAAAPQTDIRVTRSRSKRASSEASPAASQGLTPTAMTVLGLLPRLLHSLQQQALSLALHTCLWQCWLLRSYLLHCSLDLLPH